MSDSDQEGKVLVSQQQTNSSKSRCSFCSQVYLNLNYEVEANSNISFLYSVILLEAAARNDIEEGNIFI